MPAGLCTVDENSSTRFVCVINDFFNRIDGSKRIGHMIDKHQFGLFVQQIIVGMHIESSVIGHRNHAQYSATALTHHLPRHNIGVVF